MSFKVEEMTVERFCKIQDNPVQRNTKRHAHQASRPNGPLAELAPTHHRVAIARKGKQEWVLDGHTRRYLWERDQLEKPPKLLVDVYLVKDKEEVIELYNMFDNVASAEKLHDKMFGCFRYHGFYPEKTIYQNAGTFSCMKRLAFPTKYIDLKNLSTMELIEPWIPSFKIIESSPFINNHFLFPSYVMCAFLMTLVADGNKALSFWEAYACDEGDKKAKDCDGIYAARERAEFWKMKVERVQANTALKVYTPTLLYFYDAWKAGMRLSTVTSAGKHRYGLEAKNDKLVPLSEWWQTNIGEYFYPQIRSLKAESVEEKATKRAARKKAAIKKAA